MSILEKEIHEQPEVIRRLLETETENVNQLVTQLRGCFKYIVIAARGSSDNAARYAQYLFGAYNGFPVSLTTPALFTLYHRPPRLDGALVIGISQSGQSPDIVEVVAEGRRQNQPTLAITNDPASPLSKTAEYFIRLNSGPERAIAATKTYTASLGVLSLFSAAYEGDIERLIQLQRLPDLMEQTLNLLMPVLKRVERYRYMAHCIVIGRGFNYGTAFEIALKIKELTQTITEPYSSADFRHGPIAMVRDGFPVMVIAPKGMVQDDISELVTDLKKRDAELLIISDDSKLLDQAHLALPISPDVPEWLSPLIAVIPGQLFGLALTQARGLNPDLPHGLTKVTETL